MTRPAMVADMRFDALLNGENTREVTCASRCDRSHYTAMARCSRSALRTVQKIAVMIATVAALTRCTSGGVPTSPRVVCSDPSPAFGIRIKDVQTQRYVASGSSVIASTSTYAETVTAGASFPDSQPVFLGYRPGTYSLLVRKPKYSDWTAGGFVVKPAAAPCVGNPGDHLDFDAELQALPQVSAGTTL